MRNIPLISVITACYNTAEYLEQCIQSVIHQKYTDMEYVVIDGGSTDGTREIISQYGKQLAYWHSMPDRGLAHAWNQGIARARGRWLLFLNADDYLCDSDVLARLAAVVESHGDVDVVYGQVAFVSRETHAKRLGEPFGGPFAWSEFVTRSTIPHPATLTKREYFDRVGLFREDFRIAVDYELYLRSGPTLKTCFVPILVSCMRIGGMSRVMGREVLREWLRAVTINKSLPRAQAQIWYWYLVFRRVIGQIMQDVFFWRRFRTNLHGDR
jgi:glycosyltransferase involved in cell wall biosynthesis